MRALHIETAVRTLIEMAVLCLPLGVDGTIISFQLYYCFSLVGYTISKNLHVTTSCVRSHNMHFTKVKLFTGFPRHRDVSEMNFSFSVPGAVKEKNYLPRMLALIEPNN